MRVVAGANDGRTSRLDIGFGVAAGLVTVVVGCFVASWLYPPGVDADRLFVLAVFIAGFAAVAGNALAALVTAGLAWPFYLGFLVDRYGELHWHGWVDLVRLAVLAVAALLGTAVGDRVRKDRAARARSFVLIGPIKAPNVTDRGNGRTARVRPNGDTAPRQAHSTRDRGTWLT